jgi:flagellar biosynthesis protein FliP
MRKGFWFYLLLFATGIAMLLGAGGSAEAQSVTIDTGSDGELTERVIQLIALLTILSLAPSIVIMTTSFVRIIVVLSLLRTGLGLQQSPPNAVLISLALFLTAFIMAPVFTQSYNDGIEPLLNGEIEMMEAFDRSSGKNPQLCLARRSTSVIGQAFRKSSSPCKQRSTSPRKVFFGLPKSRETACSTYSRSRSVNSNSTLASLRPTNWAAKCKSSSIMRDFSESRQK